MVLFVPGCFLLFGVIVCYFDITLIRGDCG